MYNGWRPSLQRLYRISAVHQLFVGPLHIYTKIDPTWINRCRISLRSIQVHFEKVFTLVQIDLSSHSNSDSFKSISDSFRSISASFRSILLRSRFPLRKVFTLVQIDLSSHSSVHISSDVFSLGSISDRPNSLV